MKKVFVLIAMLGWILSASLWAAEKAPDFTLMDASGAKHSLSDYKDKIVVLEWNNPDCPFVKKHYSSGNMQDLQKTYTEKGVVWLAINSSAPGKQGNYAPEKLTDIAKLNNSVPTAILLDSDGKVGRTYGAKTTPHMFVISPKGEIIYQGAIDDKASVDPSDVEGANNYVRAALDETMAGEDVSEPNTSPYGCSVKY